MTRSEKTTRGKWVRLAGVAFSWGPPIVYACLIFFLSSQSRFVIGDKQVLIWDKMVHFFEYAVLGLLIYRAWARHLRVRISGDGDVSRLPGKMAVVVIVVITCLYGATDEFHQRFVPGRSSDVRDWLMDALGAIVFLAPFLLFSQEGKRRRRRESGGMNKVGNSTLAEET